MLDKGKIKAYNTVNTDETDNTRGKKMIFEKGKTIFESIVLEYKRYIEMGVYKDGDKLPSVRALASSLGVNPNTVQKAYTQMEADGYIQTLEKKGVYVTYKARIDRKDLIEKAKKEIKKLKASGLTVEEIVGIAKGDYDD